MCGHTLEEGPLGFFVYRTWSLFNNRLEIFCFFLLSTCKVLIPTLVGVGRELLIQEYDSKLPTLILLSIGR